MSSSPALTDISWIKSEYGALADMGRFSIIFSRSLISLGSVVCAFCVCKPSMANCNSWAGSMAAPVSWPICIICCISSSVITAPYSLRIICIISSSVITAPYSLRKGVIGDWFSIISLVQGIFCIGGRVSIISLVSNRLET